MRFDLVTIFPGFFASTLEHGVVARARQAGRLQIEIHNLRDYAPPPHHITDDRPFGGGEGMVMKPEPIHACLAALLGRAPGPAAPASGVRVALLSAQGRAFRQADARRFASLERLILICGRYEGVDERVAAHMVDEEISIGDFVLSGGELAAAVVLDATARLLPGVLGDPESALNESFSAPEQLDCPHYTRPVEFAGWEVPEVLRQGNHANIARWRRRQALRKTRAQRPDLFAQLSLTPADREGLE
ncbi:MAG TPA: tRNA (guanosine(37)-N1)-methyltransferase TrmD [Terriglobales bacterium]|nr:tRNA (guanosine(37)-N1)-methyltransferase TrmD [Terriglobales bacterium]